MKEQIIKVSFFLLGSLSTAPAISIPISGYISLFSILWFFCLIYLIISGFDLRSNFRSQSYKHFCIWLFISILSSIFGYVFFSFEDKIWQDTVIGGIIKIFQYLIFVFLLVHHSKKELIINSILKGLLIGMVANIVWAIIDATGYYLAGISINNTIFSGYAEAVGARFGILSLTYGPTIRATGFNMDPANVGLFIVVVASYALRKNRFLLLLCVLGIYASGSMTAVLGILFSSIIYFRKNLQKLIGILIFTLGLSIILPKDNIVVNSAMSLMNDRIEQKKSANNDDSNLRVLYLKYFVDCVADMPTSLLIGTGFHTSSYPYLKYGYCKDEIFRPYDPEQTYIAIFFSSGLLGFLFFLMLNFGLFRQYYHKDFKNISNTYMIQYSGIEAMIITYFTYHYVLYSVTMLFYITGIAMSKKQTV